MPQTARKLAPRRRKAIFVASLAVQATLDDHATFFQLIQARVENRRRNAGKPALQDVEPAAAEEHFAHDEDRPGISDDLGRFRYRAELTILAHTISLA